MKNFKRKSKPKGTRKAPSELPDPDNIVKREVKICGVHAVQSVINKRPDDIVRMYLTNKWVAKFATFLKTLARKRQTYHIVTTEEIKAISGTVHNEGLCVIAKDVNCLPIAEAAMFRSIAAFCGIENPHNWGAILRSAAHFGIEAVIVETAGSFSWPASTHRVAEGGVEYVATIAVQDLAVAIDFLKQKDFKVLAAATEGSVKLHDFCFPEKSCLLLGSESEGISKRLAEKSDYFIRIDGTGTMQSLNVASASSVFFAQWWHSRLRPRGSSQKT